MRLRSLNVASGVTILAALGAMSAVPALRGAIASAEHPESPRIDYLGAAQRAPDDYQAWLAALAKSPATVAPCGSPRSRMEAAYAQAVELAPSDATPHILFARRLTFVVPLLRTEGNVVRTGHNEYDLPVKEGPLTPEQRLGLKKADEALARARHIEPHNAAVDYLRAYYELIAHEDEDAHASLRSALDKTDWDLHTREATVAVYGAQLAADPFIASFAYGDNFDDDSLDLHKLPELLVGMAVLAQRRGDAAQAVFLRRSVMHLGLLRASHPYLARDVAYGQEIWQVAACLPLSPPEKARVTERIRREKPGASKDELEAAIYRQSIPPQIEKFKAYLRQQGYGSLAGQLDQQRGELQAKREQIRTALRSSRDYLSPISALQPYLLQFPYMIWFNLEALLLIGLSSLLLRIFRRPSQPVPWPLWGWLIVIATCAAAVLPIGSRPAFAFTIGQFLLLVSALVIVIIHRRRHAEARAVGPVRNYLGTAVSLLLPLGAVVCLTWLVLTGTTALLMSRTERENRRMIYEGEYNYYSAISDNLIAQKGTAHSRD